MLLIGPTPHEDIYISFRQETKRQGKQRTGSKKSELLPSVCQIFISKEFEDRNEPGTFGHTNEGVPGTVNTMKPWLMDILCCPDCKGKLRLDVHLEEENEVLEGTLVCPACALGFSVQDGIPNLLLEEAKSLKQETD